MAEIAIAVVNELAEPAAREDWELLTAMRHADFKNKSRRRPEWKFTKSSGALTRENKKESLKA
ncbi:hypothetical protein TWF970_000734 [Orbilia oligospora]|uniref:Uncharacterized protein n=1 Tax=Orbilia oligospora TaxID=2813651 RepID=A0A7C8RKN3_ORBOL|nr:hypothetical protein TWF970_000734 [Orbilia oligospora]